MKQYQPSCMSMRTALVLALIFPTLLSAQSLWQHQMGRKTLAFEILKPNSAGG